MFTFYTPIMNKLLATATLVALSTQIVSAANIEFAVDPATLGGHALSAHGEVGQSFITPATDITAGIYLKYSAETAAVLGATNPNSTVTVKLYSGENLAPENLVAMSEVAVDETQDGYLDLSYTGLSLDGIYTLSVAQNDAGWVVPSVCSYPADGQPTGVYADGHPFLQGNIVTDETGICDNLFHVIDPNYVAPVDPTPVDPTPDTEAPAITILGDVSVVTPYATSYTDAGATCTDNVDTDCAVTVAGSVDTQTAGNYTISYSATDAAGNTATVARTVVVLPPPDTEAPKIILTGSGNETVFLEEKVYADPGATCTDNADTSCTAIAQNTIYINTPGTKTITYTATDAAGNIATSTRTINVIMKPPVTPVLVPGQKVSGFGPYGGVGYDSIGTYYLFGSMKVYRDAKTKINTTNKDKMFIPYVYYFDGVVQTNGTILATKIYSNK